MQTKTESLIEQVTKTGIKFCSAWLIWKWILVPLIDYNILAHDDAFLITCVFTVNSFILGFTIRRYFNHKHAKPQPTNVEL